MRNWNISRDPYGENELHITEALHFLLLLHLLRVTLHFVAAPTDFASLRFVVAPLTGPAVEFWAMCLAIGQGTGIIRHAFTAVGAEDVLQLSAKLLSHFTLRQRCPCN